MDHDIRGQVVSVNADEIMIAVESEEQCHSCGLKDSCVNKVLKISPSEIDYQAEKGEAVRIIYKKLLITSGLLYVFPLFAFFIGVALPGVVFGFHNELVHFISGTFFLAFALLILRIFGKQFNNKDYKIQIQALR